MPSIYDIKPRFQALLRPLVRRLAAVGVTANAVTLFAAAFSIAGGAAVAFWPTAPAPLFALPAILFARMALNAVDGMLAREHGQKSRLGGVLNELCDAISDAALYLPLALVPGVPLWLVVAVVILAIIGEMAGVVAVQVGASRRYDGPMGKSDRAFVFGALALLLALGVPRGVWVDILLWIVLALTAATIINRSRRALAEAESAVA